MAAGSFPKEAGRSRPVALGDPYGARATNHCPIRLYMVGLIRNRLDDLQSTISSENLVTYITVFADYAPGSQGESVIINVMSDL